MSAPATTPASPPAARATAVAFALALALGFVAGLASLASAPAGDRIRVGLERIERGVSWLLLGDLGTRVRGGCPGWLFLKDELEVHPDPAGAAALRARVAGLAARRLEAGGARLLVVVVPDKSRIERDHLCGLRRSSSFEGRISAWTRALAEEGVTALDLTATLERLPGERYYRTDSHWNEAGARAAAGEIARELRSRGFATASPPAQQALPAERVRRPGDLVRVAGIDWLPEPLGPGAEGVERFAVPAPAAASDDLFGDAGLPKVALAGSSFSRSASFAAYLAWQLGEPVANVSREGGDFDGSMRAYLEGATLREAPPRVVVWEVPERVLGIPVKPAERQWLEALGATGGKAP